MNNQNQNQNKWQNNNQQKNKWQNKWLNNGQQTNKTKYTKNFQQHNGQQHNGQQHNGQQHNYSDQNKQNEDNKRDIFIGTEINSEDKNELLNYLYQNVDLYQVRYTIMKTTDHAQILKQQTYHITPHFHGYNYYLVFKKLQSNNLVSAYLIYKLNLKFMREDTIDSNVKIYEINPNSLSNINTNILNDYNNTIIDGKLVFKREQKIFLINDILYFKNNKFLTFKLEDKFQKIDNDVNILNNLFDDTFMIKIIKLYKNNEMNDLVFNKIKNSDFKINGLTFLPIRTSRVYIYINDSEFDAIKNSPNLEVLTEITNIKLNKNDDIQEKELLLQKTQIVDVYEVFTIDKKCRFGVAAIPTIKISHTLRSYFANNDQLIINCKFNNQFLKWIPQIDQIDQID